MMTRLFLSTAVLLAFMLGANSAAANDDAPAPIRALKQQGLAMHGTFAAPSGLTGYAASYHDRPVAVYLMPDGEKAIVGTMIDAQGRDLSAGPLKRLVTDQAYQRAWEKLEKANWVADGSAGAPRTIYMFTDPNCPFCHQFWQAARPWIEADKVQVRHLLVGLLKPSSLPKAAAILSAHSPAAALARSERRYAQGGIKPMSDVPADIARRINRNTKLMRSLGLFATPAILYRDKSGQVQVKQGLPQGEDMIRIMGSPLP